LYVAAFAAASGLLLALALWYLHAQALRSGQQLAQALSHVIAEQTTRSVQAVEQRLQRAAHDLMDLREEHGMDEATGRAFLRTQLENLPYVRAVWTLDTEGRIELDSDVGNIGLSLVDREYFQVYRTAPGTGFFLGPLVRSRTTGGWLISASVPLYDARGHWRGVMVAGLEPRFFETLWRQLELGQQGAVGLFHRNGQLMMRSPPQPESLGRNLSGLPLFTELLPRSPEGQFSMVSAIDGVRRVAAYRVLPAYSQLVVVVGSSMDHVLASWRRFAALTVGVWLLAVAGAGALGRQLQRQWDQRRHLEQRFRELAQAMPQVVFVANAGGVVEFVNERWTEVTGLPVDVALGRHWFELAHPDDDVGDEGPGAGPEGIAPLQAQLRLPHAGDGHRWHLVRAVPNRDAAGAVVSWFGTATDVHDLKVAQEELRRQADEIRDLNATLEVRIAQRTRELAAQEALFRTLSEQAPLPIWTVDPEGRVTFFSRAWYQLVGGEPPQGLGEEWIARVHPEDMPAVRENWLRSSREGRVYEGTRRLRARDGTWHTTTYRATPVRGEDGQVQFWVGVDTDITDLMANEAALRMANEQLRAFSYSVSHDLQSPLQRIRSFAQLLEREPQVTAAGTRAAHYLQRIVANTDQMVQMVQGMLALSRVTEAPLVRQCLDVSLLATHTLEQLQADDPHRKVRWQVTPGLQALGDPGLMRSVLENLLGNAWKFTSRTPGALIEVGRGAGGEFFVRDNGAGFDMAHAGKLFGAFERLHRQDEFPGSGIGLATVARAIARQGGHVWAEGAPGRGATFYFTLPMPA
jgi:PAS domain S-box-containing protein